MSEAVDYGKCTEAELLEIARHIDPVRSGEKFAALTAALEGRGYEVTLTESSGVRVALRADVPRRSFDAPVRFGEERGPLSWLEPSRNDLRLVGVGRIEVGNATARITGRRLTLLGGPFFKHTRTFDRERIVNVEIQGNAMRLEHRAASGGTKAVSFQLASAAEAEQLAQLLPTQHTPDFRAQLPDAIQFEERLLRRNPHAPVTLAILAINVLLFLLMQFAGAGLVTANPPVYILWGSNFGPFTADGEWWRLITNTFLHFGIVHLLFNMWAIAATGPLVERLYGSVSYALAYVIAAVAGSLASIAVHPHLNSAGASGAIFGIYGLLLAALLRGGRSIPGGVVRALRTSVLVFTLYSLATGFISAGVDNSAHVGGLVAGFLLGLVFAHGDIAEREPPLTTAIAAAVVAGAMLFAGIAFIVPNTANRLKGTAAFWNAQHWISTRELAASRKQSELWQQVHAKKLDDNAFANAIESSVLPVWREADRRVGRVVLPSGSPLEAQLEYLRAFIGSRRNAYELCIAGARAHDPATLDRCVKELARGDAMAHRPGAKTNAK
ncbi:MAG TPA: rhomboid family intramembrane serine protease [Steroidobacteraceae bacterium]|nr:rhomboid family intramembrane serine protease [Steroidobacteraceae bacterium]